MTEIFDSHVHIWAAETPTRPWNTSGGAAVHGPPCVTADDVLATIGAAGVVGALLVPPSFEGDRNDLVMAAARAHPHRFRALGRFRVDDQGSAAGITAAVTEGMLGVRLTFTAASARWLEDDRLHWFWAFAAEHAVPVSVFAQGLLPAVARVAASFPSLKLSIDHLALGGQGSEPDSIDDLDLLRPLAALDNVAVKASALPSSFPCTYSPETVAAIVDRLLEWFGPERVFWGSDFTRAPAGHRDYAESVRTFLAGIQHRSEAEQASVMGAGMRRWFGWR